MIVPRTVRICACPALPRSGPWPAGTEVGGRCALTAFGSLRRVGDRYWFAPAPDVRRFSVVTQRLVSTAGVIGGGRATRRIADAPVELPAPVRGTPVQVEFTVAIAGRILRQRFLIPALSRSGSRARAEALTSVTCDGTAGEVLTPAFGGPRSRPLRVAVTGDGPVTVTLSGPRTRAMIRHVRVADGRSVVLTWASRRLHAGTYTVAVSAPRSFLPERFTLAAVRAAPPAAKRPPRRRRGQHPV